MRCSNCQTELEEGAVFCHECGTRVMTQPQPQKAMFCSNCGEKLEEDSIFCPNCGTRVEDENDDGGVGETEKPLKAKSNTEKESSGLNKGPIIAAVVVGIILIIVCILVSIKLINKEKDTDETENLQGTGTVVENEDDNAGEADKDEAGDVISPETEESVSVTPKPTATPTPEPTEEPLTISVPDAKPDISSYFKVNVSAATATSTIVQQGHDNSAMKAFDGDEVSSWQEGVDGYGIGEGITGYFDKAYNVKYIFLKLGNWRDVTNNVENSRPQTITITCDEFTQEFTFPDEQREFYIELSNEVSMTYIDIKINAVYPGSKYDDTVIADVAVYGK